MARKNKKKAKRWDTEDGDALLHYNALDCCATARVDREILREEEWLSPRVQKLFDIHERLSKLGSEMHLTGFMVHEINRKRLMKQLRMLSTRRHNELIAHVGPRRSPAYRGTDGDMRALLYQRHSVDGIRCYAIPEPESWDKEMWTDETATTLSVDRASLMRIFINPSTPSDAQDAIQLFWRAKAPHKALSTWVDGKQVREGICDDGRMRAEWNSAGTETMRWSGPLMTLPQEKDDESMSGKLPNIRAMYCARPGYNLLHWDWSQQELRMWRAIYKDEALGEAIATGDVYSYDARRWFPVQLERLFGPSWREINLKKQWPNGRRQCKVIHLGAQYMAGAPVIWTQGLLQDRSLQFHAVKTLHGAMHDTYKVGFDNLHREHESVDKLGYSEGRILFGRRYYPAPPPITETGNFPVQRTAGEMGALTMLAIADIIKREKMPVFYLTNEHDAGTLEYLHRDSIERELADVIRKCAEGPWKIEGEWHSFPVAYHTGHTWADACAD